MAVLEPGKVFIGASTKPEYIDLRFANRHGLITGATGTGKTVTLQILAEGFSAPACRCSAPTSRATCRASPRPASPRISSPSAPAEIGFDRRVHVRGFPVVFWDLFGKQGHPIRTTISEMGPLLLARLLDLNDTQEGVLNIAFKLADDEGPAAARPQGSAGAAGPGRRERGRAVDALRQRRHGDRRRDPARAAGAGTAGRRAVLRRAGAGHRRHDAHRRATGAARHRPRRRQADAVAAALRDLPAVAAVGTVRGAARGRRSGQAEAGLLLRRGASAVRRCAQGAGRQGRAGGPADPLQGRRRLFRHPEPGRRARQPCWASSATASSTRCAPTRRATRRR